MNVSNRALLFIGGGATLAALPMGLAVRLLGASFLAIGAWLLRPEKDPPLTRKLGYASALLAAWAALVLLDNAAQGLALLLPGAVIGGDALRRLAELNAWSYATRAWRHTTRVAAVVYGVALVVVATVWLIGGAEGDPVFRLAGAAWVALPAIYAVRATALMARDQSQASDAEVPGLTRFAAGKAGLFVTGAVLLFPLWLLIPVCVHHLTSPTFRTFAKQNHGTWQPPALPSGAIRTGGGLLPVWQVGEVYGFRTKEGDPPFPAERQSVGHRSKLTLYHGERRLLELEHQIIATLDTTTGDLLGARVHVLKLEHAPGFQATCLTRIDMDREPADATARQVPFVVHIGLVSGSGDQVVITERAKGLPVGDLVVLPGATKGEPPWFLEGLDFLPPGDLPPPGEGIRILASIQGQLELRKEGFKSVRVGTVAQVKANTLEFSYSANLAETALVQYPKRDLQTPRTRSWANVRRWNGKVW